MNIKLAVFVVSLLFAVSVGATPLHDAARTGNEEAIAQLLTADADVEVTDYTGLTPMHAAAWHGHVGAIEALVPVHRGFDRFKRHERVRRGGAKDRRGSAFRERGER